MHLDRSLGTRRHAGGEYAVPSTWYEVRQCISGSRCRRAFREPRTGSRYSVLKYSVRQWQFLKPPHLPHRIHRMSDVARDRPRLLRRAGEVGHRAAEPRRAELEEIEAQI